MFYQEALPKFQFLSCVDSLLTFGDTHCQKVAATFEKAESANSHPFVVPFHMGAYFCMGAYKCDVVVVIKMGACIHGVLNLCGCLLSRFYGMFEIVLCGFACRLLWSCFYACTVFACICYHEVMYVQYLVSLDWLGITSFPDCHGKSGQGPGNETKLPCYL